MRIRETMTTNMNHKECREHKAMDSSLCSLWLKSFVSGTARSGTAATGRKKSGGL